MSSENQQNKQTVQILLPLPFNETFSYACEENNRPPKGAFVEVPFGKRTLFGIVWETDNVKTDIDESKIKPIGRVLPLPALNDSLLKLIAWVAGYTLFPLGSVLKLCLTSDELLTQKDLYGYVLNTKIPENLRQTSARKKVLSLNFDTPLSFGEIAQKAGVSSGVVTELFKSNALVRQKLPDFPAVSYAFYGADLSTEQNNAAKVLESTVGNGFSSVLLEGVTGSGKTEVYFKAVAKALSQNKQVLVLLPEIGLTAQWSERFEKRFGSKPFLWHSDLSPAVRRDTFQGVLNGKIKIVAGARSALFLPFKDLGLIIVDEEHDSSYKQEEGITYHARNMAVVRAKIENIPVILSSATPSLETTVNASDGRYRHVLLKNRYNKAVLPDIQIIDMRENPPIDAENRKSFLSPVLLNAVKENLEKKEQSLLFLNRRGYAPLVLCRTCGNRFQCPYCSAWLVEHKQTNRLMCHHCGYTVKKPACCPVCQKEETLTSCGPGAERVFEEITQKFPDARALLITSDSVVSPKAFEETLARIENNETDIIVATQMLAKGYHFAHLTLVGAVDADLGLQGGDLRAGEKTFQLLQQVAGRSGRENKKGRVLLQTYAPENAVITALSQNDRDSFLNAERQAREELFMPPFGRMAALIISGRNQRQTQETAFAFGKTAPYGKGIRVLGPAPAPLAVLRGKYRYRLLLQTKPDAPQIQGVVKQWLSIVQIPASVQVKVDIDPYSFF